MCCLEISGCLLLSENTTRVGKCTYSVRDIVMATNSIANTEEKLYLFEKKSDNNNVTKKRKPTIPVGA